MAINIYSQPWVSKFIPHDYEFFDIVVFPFIIYSCGKEEVSRSHRKHAEFHWWHQLRWLVIPYFIAYWIMRLRYSYWEHPWEIMAREAEDE